MFSVYSINIFKGQRLTKVNISPCCYLKVEKLARTLFLWKIEVHEQKEKVYEMRRWNEALVTNMLPEHVARHFLGSKKRDEVRPRHPQASKNNMLVLSDRRSDASLSCESVPGVVQSVL